MKSFARAAILAGASAIVTAAATSLLAGDPKRLKANESDEKTAPGSLTAPASSGAPRGLISPGGGQRSLENCVPAANCSAAGKPCYLEISQRDPIVSLVGIDGGGSPVQQKAAYRIRLCTEEGDSVCGGTSAEQRLNYNVFNYANAADPYVLNEQLSTVAGKLDTGPYSTLGPHNFFGVVCLDGPGPCRIAWQYCELPAPDPGKTQ